MTTQKNTFLLRFFRTVKHVGLSPGRFYSELSEPGNYVPPVSFLIITAAVNAIISTLLMPNGPLFMISLYFLNAIGMPFLIASLLFAITSVVFKGTFKQFRILFNIVAYANVTFLFSWIPGISWISTLWNFYLIGIGMVKAGPVSGLKACICMITALLILVVLLQYLYPLIKSIPVAGG